MAETEQERRDRHKHDGWIGVDLDGTLARYDGWKGPAHIGEPIPGMLERVKAWRLEGRDVRIFTARVGPQPAGEDLLARAAIEAWCLHHLGEALPVTATKDFAMLELWDDRAIQVVPNTGVRVDRKDEPARPITGSEAVPTARQVEVELLFEPFFAGLFPDFAARAHARELARLVAPRLTALDGEVEDLSRARRNAELGFESQRSTVTQLVDLLRKALPGIPLDGLTPYGVVNQAIGALERARERADHLAWVGGMVLGIAEGQPGWALVRDYPVGDPRAEGMPALRAVKQLRLNVQAAMQREGRNLAKIACLEKDLADARAAFEALSASADATRQELEQLRAGPGPEDLTEPETLAYPLPGSTVHVVTCPDALNPANPEVTLHCAEAARCHQVLTEKAPGLVRLHGELRRVAAPS